MGLRSHHYLIFCALFLASFWCGVASADESGSTLVVVKGVPLAGPLQDLPGSATVLNASEILGGGADFLQNQIQNIPNMNWSGGTSRPRFFQIRGVGDLEQFEGAPNSSVAVILDDVDVTGVGAALTLFDISQFEVHRGPQPVRFGSSALAGALHLTTTEPTEFTTGQAQFTLGNDLLAAGGGAELVRLAIAKMVFATMSIWDLTPPTTERNSLAVRRLLILPPLPLRLHYLRLMRSLIMGTMHLAFRTNL